ncbi:alpha/beta hydrolase [uncultured Clostridium sp.]|uniref:alpha/beta hydrolase n=1 Tax=uncultured Clostridium sp. TaxID=59620 RepID=UPI00262B0A90|nr:alpha/beta hydrolase [uncultured Clostridium sp.]
MKKVLKGIGIILIIGIIILTFLGIKYRGQIEFYINTIKNYKTIEVNAKAIPLSGTKNESMKDSQNIVINEKENNKVILNIYKSEKHLKSGSPVIIYVHGGAWMYGNSEIPENMSGVINQFRKAGYTIISVDYTLDTKTIDFNLQTTEVKDAIRWVYKNSEEYNFNTNSIGIIGASAGANLAMLAAYSDNDKFVGNESLKDYSSKVNYVVDLFGPTELSSLSENGESKELLEAVNKKEANLKTKAALKDYMDTYSPINYIKKGLPKTLIIQGKDDKIVPYSNSVDLYDKSKEVGNDVNLILLNNMGHAFTNINEKQTKEVIYKLLNFILFNSKL